MSSSFNPGAQVYGIAVGTAPLGATGALPFVTNTVPSTVSVQGPYGPWKVGQEWINYLTGGVYVLTSLTSTLGAVSASWTLMGNAAGTVATLTADSGGALSPSLGNFNLLGTANQITTAGAGSTITFSLPAAITAPGSLTTTTTLAVGTSATVGTTLGVTGTSTLAALTQVGTANINASGAGVSTIGTGGTGAVNIGNATGNTAVTGNLAATGNITSSAGNVVISGAAKQLQVEGGAVTDFIGTATLTAGTVTVSNTNIAAGDRIFIQRTAVNASTLLGELAYTISAATSFTIEARETATPGDVETGDASSVAYFIVRQL